MVFLYKRENIAKKKAKIRIGYQCFGCFRKFRSRRALHEHQGDAWPACPTEITPLLHLVDNSVDKGKQALQ